ncbi:MAG: S-methyl-5'-thioadenosine phosphorylase [Thermoplasmata archaeon]
MTSPRQTIGVIGGSGISEFFSTPTKSHSLTTPWGAPSAPVFEGMVGSVRVLFLPRHGIRHTIPPHRVNYRANIEALVTLGAQAIVTVSSVGSLQEELQPGTLVLPDQFIDLTKQRPTTFYDADKVYHVSLADPFCPDLSRKAAAAGRAVGIPFAEGKTYVCVEGPRFSTRAESRYFRQFADIIGMTLVPEVTLARERAVCYLCMAMVTDFDVWADHPVDAHDIVRVMRENVSKVRNVLDRLIPEIAAPPECECANALASAGV